MKDLSENASAVCFIASVIASGLLLGLHAEASGPASQWAMGVAVFTMFAVIAYVAGIVGMLTSKR